MPIYEYSCPQCDHVFEEWQKDFVERELNCPQCGAPSKRLISNTAFILKGSGWYVTDYANGKKNGDHGTEKTESKSNGESAPAKNNGEQAANSKDQSTQDNSNKPAPSEKKGPKAPQESKTASRT